MSSSDDTFSENIQVDLDNPGILKAKGVKMDSSHRAHLIWPYLLQPEINEINVAMQEFLSHFEVTLFLDLASTEMPVEVHTLKTIFLSMLKLEQMIQSTSTTNLIITMKFVTNRNQMTILLMIRMTCNQITQKRVAWIEC
jgi:hypothetical protein